MTGRLLDAAECERIGLVNRVVPQARLRDEARALAMELANGPPLAVRWTKAALNQHIWQQVVNTHHFALGVESLTIASEDTKEGARAFAEKGRRTGRAGSGADRRPRRRLPLRFGLLATAVDGEAGTVVAPAP